MLLIDGYAKQGDIFLISPKDQAVRTSARDKFSPPQLIALNDLLRRQPESPSHSLRCLEPKVMDILREQLKLN